MIKVLKFSATWCVPCKSLAETLKDVDGITTVDVDEDVDTAKKYNIRSVPTLVFLKDGEEVARQSGALSLAQYEKLLESVSK